VALLLASVMLESSPFVSAKAVAFERASMLLELLGLAYADHDYHASEKQFIKKVAKACEISEHELQDMEFWVVRQHALAHEVTQFMED
jgi:uncharacterized tellurite resistance protein B-like protein